VLRVSAETKILICGQAPGRRVHESGLPFNDASGDRLRAWMGVDRDVFYGDRRIGVAAMAFCYPGVSPKGGDHPPPPRCAALWRDALLACLPKVELTLLVGGYAQRWSLARTVPPSAPEPSWPGVAATVGRWRDYLPDRIVLPHPSWRNTAWLKRNPWFDADVAPYLRQRVRDILSP
jgi:uracil-DNA glycosylase